MFKSISILLLCMLANIASASTQEAENALKEFEGKVLIFRHPLHDDSLRYDAEGKVLKGGHEESWTTNGVLLIDRIELTPEKISIAGRRIFIVFGKNGLVLLEFKRLKDRGSPPLSPSIKTEITLGQPVNSSEQARTVLGRVFALNTADLFDSLPDFWRRYTTTMPWYFSYCAIAEYSGAAVNLATGAFTLSSFPTWKTGFSASASTGRDFAVGSTL